ncbi:MAG: aldehyde dehydrogenase family protein [Methylacidiphilales bacterium]|nr:aldehyde dehydrogenase family protein [Candidatus Methylacidiphilales bacterium]
MKTPFLPAVAEFLKASPLPHFINGRRHPGGATRAVINPVDGSVLAEVAYGSETEVNQAVTAAQNAFPAWAARPAVERSILLHRLAERMEKEAAVLAQIESLDVGKAITATEGFDIPFGIACIRYFADLATQAQYDMPLAIKNIEARVHRAPYGVCGFIFPWNFPFDLLLWGIIPALAAGNTVVVKPSEVTPLSTLYVAQLASECGFPAGVVNVVVGDGAGVGAPLTAHPLVRRMSFTGSSEVGRKIGEVCGRRLIPSKLELGGKGAAVVFDDADVASTAKQLAGAITFNTGQVCCTATRWIVHEKIFDSLAQQAAETLKATKIGVGLDPETQMGPVVSATQRDRILGYLSRGKAEGADVVLDGGPAEVRDAKGGFFVKPWLLAGSPENVCCREEIFGPAAYLVKFRDEAEAVEIVNRLDYGLANSVWSTDLARANRVAERLVAGNNWVNAHNVFAYGLPYGGVNRSGLGGGVNSPATFYDYLRDATIARPLA